jgi:D-glycero-D-manno-heptose 1,7-bisphosphate phosphatase
MTPAVVFLDRDGVINRKPPDGQYVIRWADFAFLPGVPEALALLADHRVRTIVVTNQRAVARGLLSAAELDDIHSQMRRVLAASGARIDAVYACTHQMGTCDCRKPGPGLLLQARNDFSDLDFGRSMVIGDSVTDLQPGVRLGCRVVLVGRGRRAAGQLTEARQLGMGSVATARSLLEAVRLHVLPRCDESSAPALVAASAIPGANHSAHDSRK